MKVVVLAAGYATRLYPLTQDKPKALLPIQGKTILDYLMDKVSLLADVDEVLLVTNDKFYKIFSEWAEQSSSNKKIRVFNDKTTSNDNRLGAIGDLQFALKAADVNDDVLVLASDNLFETNLDGVISFAKSKNAPCVVGTYDIKDPNIARGKYGVIEYDQDNKIVGIDEKPDEPKTTNVSMGVYYFSKEALSKIDEYLSGSERKDAPGHYIVWLLDKIAVYAYLFEGRWYDIGSFDQLEEADRAYQAC